jgi:hypothetical protein
VRLRAWVCTGACQRQRQPAALALHCRRVHRCSDDARSAARLAAQRARRSARAAHAAAHHSSSHARCRLARSCAVRRCGRRVRARTLQSGATKR